MTSPTIPTIRNFPAKPRHWSPPTSSSLAPGIPLRVPSSPRPNSINRSLIRYPHLLYKHGTPCPSTSTFCSAFFVSWPRMTPKLYYAQMSPASRAVLVTERALGIELEKQTVNLAAGEQMEPEFLKVGIEGGWFGEGIWFFIYPTPQWKWKVDFKMVSVWFGWVNLPI